MIRRLIILLLIVGCEEYGSAINKNVPPFESTPVIDTLYIYNYDTLIIN